jgi:hypothetical protein
MVESGTTTTLGYLEVHHDSRAIHWAGVWLLAAEIFVLLGIINTRADFHCPTIRTKGLVLSYVRTYLRHLRQMSLFPYLVSHKIIEHTFEAPLPVEGAAIALSADHHLKSLGDAPCLQKTAAD